MNPGAKCLDNPCGKALWRIVLMATLSSFGISLEAVGFQRPVQASPNIIFFFADDLGYGDLGSYNANSGVPKVLLGKYLPDVFEDAAIEFIELALLAGCCPAKRERSVLKWSPGSGEAPRIAVEVKWLLS